MTANHRQLLKKENSGSILIELNFLFIILLLAGGMGFRSTQAVLSNYKRIMADMEIARNARYTESILSRELSYNTTQVRLGKDLNGRDQIIGRKTFENVRCYWYISNSVLYRKTVKDTSTGINPFSDPGIEITDFRTVRLEDKKLGILMTMKHTKTGLIRTVPVVLFLNNGHIAD